MIAVIDYGAGNLQSVTNALTKLGRKFVVVRDANEFERFDARFAEIGKVILPGVGAAGYAMTELGKRGFTGILRNLKIPFLGVCLGMQLLGEYSEEGEVECLGVISGRVRKFPKNNNSAENSAAILKVPQIGWNRVELVKNSPLFAGLADREYFYFVNSYYLPVDNDNLVAGASYGVKFVAAVQQKNYYGVQFHPEKSGAAGLKLLNNFCTKC